MFSLIWVSIRKNHTLNHSVVKRRPYDKWRLGIYHLHCVDRCGCCKCQVWWRDPGGSPYCRTLDRASSDPWRTRSPGHLHIGLSRDRGSWSGPAAPSSGRCTAKQRNHIIRRSVLYLVSKNCLFYNLCLRPMWFNNQLRAKIYEKLRYSFFPLDAAIKFRHYGLP